MPYLPEKRQYRNIVGTFSALEPTQTESGLWVEGYATTFDDPYDFGPEGCKEAISSRALDGADMNDVIFQFDHAGTPLARQRNKTLEVGCDAKGLFVRANLIGCQQGRDLHEAIRNGLVDRMSWGFSIADGGWEWDKSTRTSTITKVAKVYDVSAVSRPANEGTEIKARSYLDGVIEMEQQELLRAEEERRARIALRMRMLR